MAVNLPYSETWTGTSGSWPVAWITRKGTATLSTNQGLLSPGTGAYATSRVDLDMTPTTNTDVVVQITGQIAGVEQYAWVGINADPTNETGNGNSIYEIQFQLNYNATAASSAVSMFQGTTQIGASVTKTLTGTTAYRARLRRSRGVVYARVWAATVAEPTAWDFTIPESSFNNPPTAGVVTVGSSNGAATTARTFLYDNLDAWVGVTEELWTGTTGAVWPAAWTHKSGTSTIQTNAGRQITASGSAYLAGRDDHVSMAAVGETDIYLTFTATSTAVEQYFGVTIDSDNTGTSWKPTTGYEFCVSFNATAASSAVDVRSVSGGTETTLQQITKTMAGATAYRLHFQRFGSTIRARVWTASSAEPTTWDVTGTAGTIYSGRVNIWSSNGADGVARTFTVDDLLVNSGYIGTSSTVASFTMSPTTGIVTTGVAPLVVTFTDTSSNTPTSWSWDFGDGTTSTSQNPSKTYTVAGIYTPRLTATNSGGSSTYGLQQVVATSTSLISLPYTETWTGTDGSAWSSIWTGSQITGTGGAATILSNAGQISEGASASGIYREFLTSMPAINDTNLAFTFTQATQAEAYIYAGISCDNTSSSTAQYPNNGYVLEFGYAATAASGYVKVSKILAGTRTTIIAQATTTLTAGTTYYARFQRQGTIIYYKLWTTTEPTSWTGSATDSGTLVQSGKVLLSAGNGTTASARPVTFSNATISATAGMSQWLASLSTQSKIPAKWLATGDSFTEGQGASVRTNRWVDIVNKNLRVNYGVTSGGSGYLQSVYGVFTPDSTWRDWRTTSSGTVALDTNAGSWGPTFGTHAVEMSAAAVRVYTFTGTDLDIWYIQGSAAGTMTWKIDAGTAVTVVTANALYATNRVQITGLTSASHTVTITAVTSTVYLAGFTVYNNDHGSGFQLYEGGVTTGVITNYDLPTFVPTVQMAAPDLVTVEFAANDSTVVNVATFQTNLQAFITGMQSVSTAPSILIIGIYEISTSVRITTGWSNYLNAMKTVAMNTGSSYLDMTTAMPLTTTAGTGYYSTDALHPNDMGQIKSAQIISSAMVPAPAYSQNLTVIAAGTVSTGWTASGGTFTVVQSDDGATSVLSSATANDERTFDVSTTTGLSTATITSVTVYAAMKATNASSTTAQIGIRVAGTNYYSGTLDTGTSNAYYNYFNYTWYVNPATGAAWTSGVLDTIEIGVKKINANAMSLSYMYATIVYTPLAATAGMMKSYVSGSFTAKPVKVWNGTTWGVKSAKYWNGSSWRLLGTGSGLTATYPFTDDFTAALDTSTKWTTGNTGSPATVSGKLRLTCTSTYTQTGSGYVFNMAALPVYVQVTTVPTLGNGTTQVGFAIYGPAGQTISFYIQGTPRVLAMFGTNILTTYNITYSATEHLWLRLRLDGGLMLWETSPDKVVWVIQASAIAPTWVTSGLVRVLFGCGYYGTETAPGYAELDNFNV